MVMMMCATHLIAAHFIGFQLIVLYQKIICDCACDWHDGHLESYGKEAKEIKRLFLFHAFSALSPKSRTKLIIFYLK